MLYLSLWLRSSDFCCPRGKISNFTSQFFRITSYCFLNHQHPVREWVNKHQATPKTATLFIYWKDFEEFIISGLFWQRKQIFRMNAARGRIEFGWEMPIDVELNVMQKACWWNNLSHSLKADFKWSMKNLIVFVVFPWQKLWGRGSSFLCFRYLNEKWNHLFFGSAFISVHPLFAGSLGIIMNDNINEKSVSEFAEVVRRRMCDGKTRKARKFPTLFPSFPRLSEQRRGEINVLNNKILRTFFWNKRVIFEFPLSFSLFSVFYCHTFLLPDLSTLF